MAKTDWGKFSDRRLWFASRDFVSDGNLGAVGLDDGSDHHALAAQGVKGFPCAARLSLLANILVPHGGICPNVLAQQRDAFLRI
jgi:hypothetical protein